MLCTGWSGESRTICGLRQALGRAGVDAVSMHYDLPPDQAKMREQYAAVPGLTDTFAINWHADLLYVPDGVRHHRWVQDAGWPFPQSYEVKSRPDERRWDFVKSWVRDGSEWLPPAIDVPDMPVPDPCWDAGYLGYISPDLPYPQLGADRVDLFRSVLFKDRNFASTPEHIAAVLGCAVTDVCNPDMPVMQRELLSFLQRYTLLSTVRKRYSTAFWGRACPVSLRDIYLGNLGSMDKVFAAHAAFRVALNINGDTHVHGRSLEALACGVPVVSEYVHDEAGELKASGLHDFIAVGRGEEGVCAQIGKALANKDFDPISARQTVIDRHTWDHRVEQVLARN